MFQRYLRDLTAFDAVVTYWIRLELRESNSSIEGAWRYLNSC